MIIPEDGGLPPITSSNLNAFNNIMIVKVDNKSLTPGETAFQLATLDRSKKGTVWPADNYVNKLIPNLPENKILDEQKKEFDSRKELNLFIKTTTVRPKLLRQPDQLRYHFTGNRRSNFQRRKTWNNRSEFKKGHLTKSEIDSIDPWREKPWVTQPNSLTDPKNKTALLSTPTNINYNLPFPQNEGFHDFHPPADLNHVHHNLQNAHPSVSSFHNGYPEYIRDQAPNFNSYAQKFDETPLAGSSKHYSTNNYRQNSNNEQSSNRHFKKKFPGNKSNRGSRHDSSATKRDNFDTNFTHEHEYHEYPVRDNFDTSFTHEHDEYPVRNNFDTRFTHEHDEYPVRDNFDTSFTHEREYPGNDNIGRNQLISTSTVHKNYVPISAHDPITHFSFESKEMEGSVTYDNVGNNRNNSVNASYQKQYSRPRNNRKRWRNNRFPHNANPRENVNSLIPEVHINPNLRGNVDSATPREKVDFFNSEENMISSSMSVGNANLRFRGNRNSVQKFNPYNKNQRKHWMPNKNQNFKQSVYNVNQKAYKNFRGSNVRS